MTRPRVLLASCAALPRSNADDTALPEVLAEVGVEADWAPWDDPAAPFGSADLVVLRSTWDYPVRRKEFLAWCDAVPALANPAAVARWNTDKAYLADLAAHGVPVVPTELIAPGEPLRAPEEGFVLKPAVGASSRGAARFAAGELGAARSHLAALHAEDQVVLVQPYQRAVDGEGETALVFLGGVFSHAFVKGAMLPDPAVSGPGPGERFGVLPDAALRRAAEDAVDAAAALRGLRRADLLYARVDLVRGEDGAPVLLELELTEPSLGFAQADPGALPRFASAIRAAVG
ncbi:ATP-grasp domain-containing protein [Saccharopolyspora sp. MS10]|uniref:ATP-grasp domain-containing protein n=1 Tax=Saccharopolyspora sp. MS10 TaxID=3385973 RepID=UPI0039A26210